MCMRGNIELGSDGNNYYSFKYYFKRNYEANEKALSYLMAKYCAMAFRGEKEMGRVF